MFPSRRTQSYNNANVVETISSIFSGLGPYNMSICFGPFIILNVLSETLEGKLENGTFVSICFIYLFKINTHFIIKTKFLKN